MKKPTHGGSRKGAGRKPKGKKRLCIYVEPRTVDRINELKPIYGSIGAVVDELAMRSRGV